MVLRVFSPLLMVLSTAFVRNVAKVAIVAVETKICIT